jgi:hypothetical protein
MKDIPEIKIFDTLIFIIYIIWCIGLFAGYHFGFEGEKALKSVEITGFTSAFLIYFFYNRKLNNNKICLIWTALSVVQLLLYLNYKDLRGLNIMQINALSSLKGLFVSILTYNALRYLYFKLFKSELIITSNLYFIGSRSNAERRLIRKSDFIFSIVGAIIIFALTSYHETREPSS